MTLHRTGNNLNSAGRRCILTLTLLFPAFVFLQLCMRVGENTPHEENAHGTTEASFAPSVVKKCKFEDLAASFLTPRDSSHQSSACWKIEDEFVQVPTSAILNRNNMTRLGKGFKGGVFKALIQLKDESTCYAALKTDQCSSNQGRNYRHSVPCVADGAYKTSQSFMKGEITGMLVHYAFYRRGLEVPQGILPTYAVVKAAKAPKPMKFGGRSNNVTYPADDPLHIGVIMPLREFDDIERQTNLPETFSAIAAMMLPAAIALETYHTLGLAHGDVYITNIAIDRNTGKTVLYDNSVVAKQGNCAEMCDYCVDQTIGTQLDYPHEIPAGFTAMEVDVHKMVHLIYDVFFPNIEHSRKRTRQYRLLSCRKAEELVDLLKKLRDEDE